MPNSAVKTVVVYPMKQDATTKKRFSRVKIIYGKQYDLKTQDRQKRSREVEEKFANLRITF